MLIKRGANLGILLLVLFLLVGCAGGGSTDPDEIMIHAIADSIKTAIEDKDVDMFMTNVSLDYSDSAGGTYESIRTMAQNMISQLEAVESSYGVNLTINTSISNLVVVDSTANSDLKITFSVVIIIPVYSEDRTFETIFQKVDTSWKITSMIEI
ncbi:hypothetical protein ES705_44708 [subsurface metagenome]